MRSVRVFFVSLTLALLVLPGASDARPRVFGFFRSLLGPIAGIGHRHYRRHGIAREDQGAPSKSDDEAAPSSPTPSLATPSGPTPSGPTPSAPIPPPPASLAALPRADIATVDDDFFGYVFWPGDYGSKFWAHGERDMIEAVFTKDTESPVTCSQPPQDRAESVAERIDQTVHPTDAQHAALDQLQAMLVKSFEGLAATCRDVSPLTPAERLKAMQERLNAVRNAALSIRTPLGDFYDSLNDEQKTQFVTADVTGLTETKVSGPGVPTAQDVAQICSVQTQAAYAWPTALIVRRVRPNQQERASLEALQQTLFGMAMYLNGACPKEPEQTPVARLDLAMRRVDAMVYALLAIAPALDDFYGRLSDEQKARFNSIATPST
jgi:LTXXQ motif family protein